MPRHLPKTQRAEILAHLRTPSGASATLAHLAKQFGVSIWTIHRLRASLEPAPAPPEPASILAEAAENPRAFVERILTGHATTLSTDQQRAALSEIVLHTPNPSIKVAAQNALTRLDAQAGITAALGPGPPLTDEDRAKRLSLLMSAVGLPTVRRALHLAYPRAHALSTAFGSGSATDPPPPSPEGVNTPDEDDEDPDP